MNKKNTSVVLKLLLVIIFITYVFSVVNVTKEEKTITKKQNKSNNIVEIEKKEELKEEVKIEEPVELKQEEIVEPVVETNTIANTNYNNIRISSILNDNLMKDETGEHFYLDHNIYGAYDGRGVPYIDFRNDFTGRKTIIYSHSSTSGNGPFQILQNYHYNKGFYDNNRYIEVNYNGNRYTYLIFSVYVSTADNDYSEGLEYFRRMDYSDNEWNERINYYKSKSEYDTGVEVNENDKILILQTCSMDPAYYEKYYRYNLLIMAKLV